MQEDIETIPDWEIEVDCFPSVSFALQQSSVPFIRTIKVQNNTDFTHTNVKLKISTSPEFSSTQYFVIDRLDAKKTKMWREDQCDIKLNFDYFANLSEKVNATLKLELYKDNNDSTKNIFSEKTLDIAVFAANAWTGPDLMPGLLAAFVTPNLDFIAKIQQQMSALLAKNGLNDALSGYQSNKKHVMDMLQAAYNVLATQQIAYAVAPASFDGQRIRFVNEIFKDKLANCLDFSILFAGVLEQCGLNPIIFLTKEHAFVGCHATNNTFSDAYVDELQSIKKRVQLDEIFVFDSTCALGAKPSPFKYAEEIAQKHLDGNDFEGALDVRQARNEKYMPLPLKTGGNGEFIDEKYSFSDQNDKFDERIKSRSVIELEKNSTEVQFKDRLTHWQSKLLDLTLKNRLLNFKDNSKNVKMVPLALHDIGKLEDYLNAGKVFVIHPTNQMLDGTDLRDYISLGHNIHQNPTLEYLKNELENSRIHSPYEKGKLDSKLLAIFRETSADIEEGGCNTLHIALGILEWCELDDINKSHYKAPILLIPMKLERKSATEGFSLRKADEETILNVTLLEKLVHDFKMTIPGLNADDLPKDSSGVDVEKILLLFQDAIKNIPGWEVKREAWLGRFSFQKFLMYNDLRNRTEELLKNPLVDHLLNHSTEHYDDKLKMVEPNQLDKEIKSNMIFCPLSADSSQISAVLSAERGKSFVLYGPPGTGKSQTITNIIAHCLANKKKVLFVSEKRAALDVVYRRLQNVGLGPFCLELHSNKAGKNEVMRQFREILDYDASSLDNSWDRITFQRDELRTSLKSYVEAIHRRYLNGFTPYQAFSFLIVHADKFSQIPNVLFPVSKLSEKNIIEIRQCANDIKRDSEKIETEYWRILGCINKDSWTPSWRDEVKTSCKENLSHINELLDSNHDFSTLLNLSESTKKRLNIGDVVQLAQATTTSSLLPAGLYHDDWTKISPRLQEFVQNVRDRDDLINELNGFSFKELVGVGKKDLNSKNHFFSGRRFLFSKKMSAFNASIISMDWHNNVANLINKHSVIVNSFFSAIDNSFNALGYPCGVFDEGTAVNLLTLCRLIHEAPKISASLLSAATPGFIMGAIAISDIGKRHEQLKKLLANFDLIKIRNFDVARLQARFEKNKNESNLLKRISCFFILKKMRSFVTDSAFEISLENAADLLILFVEYVETYKKIRSIPKNIAQTLDDLWDYENSDWQRMRSTLEFCKNINFAIESIVEGDVREIIQGRVCKLVMASHGHDEHDQDSLFLKLDKACLDYQNSINDILSIFRENWNCENECGKLADLFAHADNGQYATETMIEHDDFIKTISAFINKSSAINDVVSALNLKDRLGNAWNYAKLDFATWEISYNSIQRIEDVINTPVFYDLSSTLRSEIGNVLSSNMGKEQLVSNGKRLITNWENYLISIQEITGILEATLDKEDIFSWQKLLDFLTHNLETLRNWCKWCSTRNRAKELGIEAFSAMVENGDAVCSVTLAIDIALYQKFAYEVCNSADVLRDFLGHTQDNRVFQFQQLDDQYTQLASKKVISSVSSALPSKRARTNPTDTELGALCREVRRQNNIISVRKLLEKYSVLALRLKPCLLMSPLSVAQYLPAASSEFDLVIFDEASQIAPWDAIGVIARGKQLIVVGDPKQLPPTTFFQRQDCDDENILPDEQSILDECILSNMNTMHLNWHYRSRHESLIAFSNHHYYENRLLTFPAPHNDSSPMGVNFHFVENGIYAVRGRSNRIEAEKLVNHVVATLQSPNFMKSLNSDRKKSLGIITFNQPQQELIENLLDDARRKNPQIEPFFQSDYFEPVFVKNIENVQGDERDFIFFSICFAHQEGGKRISMHFGPLNKDGGERRLNVAVTRAKESISVFSSIHHDDIDLSRTNKTGPRHLKYFLEYAEKGPIALGNEITNAYIDNYDSPFEEEVAKFLRNNGHEVHTQIGTSGYRIDLAIVSQNYPGKYILGIECDGASYHSAATVRDRDKLRQRVLEGLGWTIIRIWSTDWWHSPIETKKNLLKYVEEAIKSDANTHSEIDSVISASIENFQAELPLEQKSTEEESRESAVASCEFASPYPSLNYLDSMEVFQHLNSEDFYSPFSVRLLREQVGIILEKEAPITESLLLKRIVRVWGFQRTGEKINSILIKVLPKTYHSSPDEKVYWINKDDRNTYDNFRIPSSGIEPARKLEEIPVDELKNAMRFINSEYQGFDSEEALFKETGRLFGFSRLTAQAQPRYNAALQLLRKSGVEVDIS